MSCLSHSSLVLVVRLEPGPLASLQGLLVQQLHRACVCFCLSEYGMNSMVLLLFHFLDPKTIKETIWKSSQIYPVSCCDARLRTPQPQPPQG